MKTRTTLIATTIAAAFSALTAQNAAAAVVAHWTFDSQSEFDAGMFSDVSGNGNALGVQTLGTPVAGESAQFVDLGNGRGAVRLNGTKNAAQGGGLAGNYYSTGAGAALNSATFASGYTIEVSFKVPADWSGSSNSWMGALTRSGKPSGDPAAVMAISNLGELQWQSQGIGGHERSAWSPVIFPTLTGWHQATFVNYEDNGTWRVDMYIDGTKMTRNVADPNHDGIASYDAPWYVGLGLWDNNPDSPWNGYINDIRISDSALAPADFYTAPVPVPAALPLFLSALVGLGVMRRKG